MRPLMRTATLPCLLVGVLLWGCGSVEEAPGEPPREIGRGAPEPDPHRVVLVPSAEEASLYELRLEPGRVPYPQQGFHRSQRWPDGTWRAWSRASIEIPFWVACPEALTLSGDLVFPLRRAARVRVLVNDEVVGEEPKGDRRVELTLRLPEDAVRAGFNLLRIEFPDALVPAEVDPDSEDTRELGGSFSRLLLERAGRQRSGGSRVVESGAGVRYQLLAAAGDRLGVELKAEEAPDLLLDVREVGTGATREIYLPGSEHPWSVDLSPHAQSELQLRLRLPPSRCGQDLRYPVEQVVLNRTVPTFRTADLDGPVRLLLLGIDGATFDVIDRELEQLPNFARLAREGVRAPLRTLKPDRSPIIWATISTGQTPQEHGIQDFLYEEQGVMRVYTSRHRKEPTLWEILGHEGHSVGVLGWWNSWPAAPVRGFLVSDLLWPYPMGRPPSPRSEPPGHLVYPPHFKPRLIPKVVDESKAEGLVEELGCLSGDWHFVAEDATLVGWTLELLDSHHPEFLSLYLKNLDAFQHRYWKFMEPEAEEYPDEERPSEEEVTRFGDVIPRYHRLLDRWLGEIVERLDPEVNVLVVSDHGFGPGIDPNVTHRQLSGTHRDLGIFLAAGPAFARGVELPEMSVYDVTPTLLALFGLPAAADMEGDVVEQVFDPTFRAEVPRERIDSYHQLREGGGRTGSGALAPRQEEMLERLEELGYIEP